MLAARCDEDRLAKVVSVPIILTHKHPVIIITIDDTIGSPLSWSKQRQIFRLLIGPSADGLPLF